MRIERILCASFALLLSAASAFPQGGGRRGGIPNATPAQTEAITQMNAGLAALNSAVTAARAALATAEFAGPGGSRDAALREKAGAVGDAEFALASARTAAFEKLQASGNKLSAEQIAALAALPAGGFGRGGRGATAVPHTTPAQGDALYAVTKSTTALSRAVDNARAELAKASLTLSANPANLRQGADAVAKAELALAKARADGFSAIQASANRIDNEQIAAVAAMGGAFGVGGFSEPEPMDFKDHRGYISLFDGVSLKDWDGNPKFWRVEDGAIVGESTPTNPSGNTYIVYRGVEAKDFTLKFEIKVEGTGGSGFQYRSHSGIEWSRPIAANVIANTGPVNLAWMLTGPQADFWPSQIYTGQVYSENTPMGIEAYRGQVVEGAGLGARRLMGTIGDRTELGKLVKMNDWNEYTVIARGSTVLHIVNGQLMAAFVDDDPNSSNNKSGYFGIEIEALTKISVRNIWLKKLN